MGLIQLLGCGQCDLVTALSGGTESACSALRFQLVTTPPLSLASPGGSGSTCFMLLLTLLADTPLVGWACSALIPTASSVSSLQSSVCW